MNAFPRSCEQVGCTEGSRDGLCQPNPYLVARLMTERVVYVFEMTDIKFSDSWLAGRSVRYLVFQRATETLPVAYPGQGAGRVARVHQLLGLGKRLAFPSTST